jgi:hypothetical protein
VGCLGKSAKKRPVWQVVEAHASVEAKKRPAGSDDDDQRLLTDSIPSHASTPRRPSRSNRAVSTPSEDSISCYTVRRSSSAMAGHRRGGPPRRARPSAAALGGSAVALPWSQLASNAETEGKRYGMVWGSPISLYYLILSNR